MQPASRRTCAPPGAPWPRGGTWRRSPGVRGRRRPGARRARRRGREDTDRADRHLLLGVHEPRAAGLEVAHHVFVWTICLRTYTGGPKRSSAASTMSMARAHRRRNCGGSANHGFPAISLPVLLGFRNCPAISRRAHPLSPAIGHAAAAGTHATEGAQGPSACSWPVSRDLSATTRRRFEKTAAGRVGVSSAGPVRGPLTGCRLTCPHSCDLPILRSKDPA